MYNLTMTIEELNKHIELIAHPQKKILEIFQNVYKPFEELSEILGHQVYVDPTTFETLVSIFPTEKSRKISIEEIKANPDLCFIYTNHVKLPQYKDSCIVVDKQTAFLISKLDMSYRHRFYSGITKRPFDKYNSVLTIEEYKIKITKGTDIFRLCVMLFGSKQYITKVWTWDDIVNKVIDREKAMNSEDAFESKVKRLNKRLSVTGYTKIIIFDEKGVRVNPEFYFLFK